ncbi:UvrB/UvrC motif-containing protein [bacterium]|nr:UvrB/UvrC motif-containing protein [bacterium]
MAKQTSNLTKTIVNQPNFNGFGPSILIPQTRGRIRRNELPSDRLEGRKLLREKCPKTPGVYGWLNRDGQLTYVGKSKCLQLRLLSYYAKTPTEKKMERIRTQSKYLIWEPISDELLALLREQELIFRWTPEFNAQGQPNRRLPAFLCVSKSSAPNLFSTTRLTPRVSEAYGPIPGTGRLSEAATCVNYLFKLRDCPEKTPFEFSNQLQLFHEPPRAKCIRHELGSCPAPCAGCCTQTQYSDGLKNTMDFLEGRDRTIVKQVEKEMQLAATQMRFEQAAVLRDRFKTIRWLDRQLQRLRDTKSRLNGVIPIEARRNRIVWLVLRGGRLIDNMLEPSDLAQARLTSETLQKLAAQSSDTPSDRLDVKLQLIISAWFRKQKDWYDRVIPFEEIIQRCEKFGRSHAFCA